MRGEEGIILGPKVRSNCLQFNHIMESTGFSNLKMNFRCQHETEDLSNSNNRSSRTSSSPSDYFDESKSENNVNFRVMHCGYTDKHRKKLQLRMRSCGSQWRKVFNIEDTAVPIISSTSRASNISNEERCLYSRLGSISPAALPIFHSNCKT